jgi:hypothetical protein
LIGGLRIQHGRGSIGIDPEGEGKVFMNGPKYFVLVFGDPNLNGDRLESERYEVGDNYPQFEVRPGDMLLLYCTDGYAGYSKQFAGIGVAVQTNPRLIEYRRIPFEVPIPLRRVDHTFEPADQKSMGEIRFNTRRAFEISMSSFMRTISGQKLA